MAVPALLPQPSFAAAPEAVSAGLLSTNQQGQFNATQRDAAGNIYVLIDQHDGVRVMKFGPNASALLAQTQLGARGDIGLAMALDASGNVYITGTSSSGQLAASNTAAFPSYAGRTITSFVARLDSSLNTTFVSFTGGSRMAASAIAVSGDAVFLTGTIFAATLPVTNSAIFQAPPPGTTENGFVEKFSLDGRILLYATYLGGQNGYTAPAAIAVDAADDAYIAGYTTATGYPTLAALVPELIPTQSANGPDQQSGFVTKLTPAGDGLLFSTFIGGGGLTSLALDATGQNLYLSGSIAAGQFPVTSFAVPVAQTTYQGLVEMAASGSGISFSTAFAPSQSSALAQDTNGSVWLDGTLTAVLLPAASPNSDQPGLSDVGNGYAVRVNSQGAVDRVVRFGGIPTSNLGFTTSNLNLTSVATDASSIVVVAGSFQPAADSSLVATQFYDFPLVNAPTAALPSLVRDLIPTSASCGSTSQCVGSGGFLAKANLANAPALAISADSLPNLTMRNLGTAAATSVQLSATGYSLASNCPATVAEGGECSIALAGAGPGVLTIQSASQNFTVNLPANTAGTAPDAIAFSPKELDFGLQSSVASSGTHTVTVSNLTGQTQAFTSMLDQPTRTATGYQFSEASNDCGTGATNTDRVLAANSSCHITLSFTASSSAQDDGPVTGRWMLGSRDLLLTGFTQAAGITVSSSELDFGTQFADGLRLPRYFYLSNATSDPVIHSAVMMPTGSPFTITDNCPSEILPQTVCQVRVDYLSPKAPTADSTVLALDAGLSVLLTGQTLPQPSVNGATANPNLSVTPTQISFANPVVVTTLSTATQQVLIANTGSNAFTLALAATGDFSYTSTCPASLAGGTSCAATVTFAPSQAGLRQGLLTVTAGGGSAINVALSGTGIAIAPADNGVLDFGSVPVGEPKVQWIKLSQPFTSLTATASADFGVVLVEEQGYGHGQPSAADFQPSVTSGCVNCWIGVQFTPSAEGLLSGTLQISTTSGGNPYVLALSGAGLTLNGPYLSPASADFGPVALHSVSGAQSFNLTNGAAQPIALSAPALTGDFSLTSTTCAASLGAGESCSLALTFTPTAQGPRDGTLTLTAGQTALMSALSGYGGADPGIALNPTSLTFSNIASASAITQTVTVTNTSAANAQIGAPTAGTPSFKATTQCGTLPPNAGAASSCTIQVVYTPGSSLVTDTLQIPVTTPGASGGPSTLATYFVALSGAYSAEDAGLSITPAAMDYGPVSAMTVGSVRSYTITNLTSKSVTLTLDFPRQFSLASAPCAALAPQASCQFSVQFLPLTNGAVTGSLLVRGDPGDNSGTLDGILYLQGYGQGGSSLSISGAAPGAAATDFGTVVSGQTSKKILTLTSNGAGPLNIRRITSEFPFISTSNCAETLAAGASCAVTITYSPLYQYATGTTPPTAMQQTGTVVIESDSVSGPDILDLVGLAQAVPAQTPSNSGELISFNLSQSSLVFQPVSVGNSTAAQTVIIANTGTTTIHIAALQASPVAPATTPDFAVSNGNCVTALAPAQSCSFTVAFSPQTSGQRIGAVEIESDSSTALEFVSLLGTAQPAAISIAPARLSFGAIATGATTHLPLVLTNASSSPVTLGAISITGDYSETGNCPASGAALAAGAICTLQISFSPTQSGALTGTLSIANSATSQPLAVPLTGTGTQSQLQLGSASLNFGSVPLGQSAALTLALINNGTAPVNSLQTSIVATSDFVVTTACPSATIAAGASCLLGVTFTPTAVGARTASLSLSSSDPASPMTVPLIGTGLQTGSFSMAAASGSSLSATVQQGQAATYTLILAPTGGYQGVVALGCSPQASVPAAFCSVLAPSVALSSGPVTTTVTINTVTGTQTALTRPGTSVGPDPSAGFADHRGSKTLLALMLPLGLAFLSGIRRSRAERLPKLLLWLLLSAAAAISTQGCGSAGNPNLTYAAPGTYPYLVTATSTNGLQITQTVTLNLTVTAR
ncbi:MAG: choice-of-anchor D domain-containing protein [Acidobacteriaceae bacterium]